MLVWEFVNSLGQKLIVKENEDKTLNVDFVPFSKRITNWEYVDELTSRGKYNYIGKFDLVNKRY